MEVEDVLGVVDWNALEMYLTVDEEEIDMTQLLVGVSDDFGTEATHLYGFFADSIVKRDGLPAGLQGTLPVSEGFINNDEHSSGSNKSKAPDLVAKLPGKLENGKGLELAMLWV